MIHRCLECVGLLNRDRPRSGQWMAHTIDRVADYHWTSDDGNFWEKTLCGKRVWVGLD